MCTNGIQTIHEKRYELKKYMQAAFSRTKRANKLCVIRSTDTREIQRNSGRTRYLAKVTHQRAVYRRQGARHHKQLTDEVDDPSECGQAESFRSI